MTRAEAIDTLAQCKLLRVSIDALEAKARDRLSKPVLFSIKAGPPASVARDAVTIEREQVRGGGGRALQPSITEIAADIFNGYLATIQ